MKIRVLALLTVITGMIFISCKTPQPTNYIQDLSDTTKLNQVPFPEPRIQKGDLLSILVISEAFDEGKTDAMYNLYNPGESASNAASSGYMVDNDGNIFFPRVGPIKAEGLTKSELSAIIKNKINEKETVLYNPSVIIRLQNFNITMLGEVARPGTLNLPGERITILQAMGLSGDMTNFGKKDDILVLREVNGAVEYGKVDLTSKSIFQSPYYYLRQGDVVVVNANRNKDRVSEQIFSQRLGMTFSIINTLALLYNIFR